MLAALAPASVARMRFPLGELTKPEVRELARGAGLPVADKRDSQDLCFLAGTGKSAFLARHGGLRERPGAIVDRAGRDGRPPPRAAPVHGRPAQGARRRRGRGAALRARQGPRREHGDGRDARRAGARREVAVRDAVLHRPGAEVDRVKLRYRTRAARAAAWSPATAAALRAPPRRAGRRRRARPGRLPDARRRDRRPRRHRVVTRCHAATVAASAISPRGDHRLELGDREARAAQVLLGRLGRGRTGFESGREPDVEALVGAARRRRRACPRRSMRAGAQAGLLGQLAAGELLGRRVRRVLPGALRQVPEAAARRGGGTARRARRRSPSSGDDHARPAASRPRRTARASRRAAPAGPRGAASSGSRRPRGST